MSGLIVRGQFSVGCPIPCNGWPVLSQMFKQSLYDLGYTGLGICLSNACASHGEPSKQDKLPREGQVYLKEGCVLFNFLNNL
jgi:hypothetical protein